MLLINLIAKAIQGYVLRPSDPASPGAADNYPRHQHASFTMSPPTTTTGSPSAVDDGTTHTQFSLLIKGIRECDGEE